MHDRTEKKVVSISAQHPKGLESQTDKVTLQRCSGSLC